MAQSLDRDKELMETIHPFLRDNFLHMCTVGRVGFGQIALRDVALLKRKPIESKYAYSFRVQIPYATKFIFWEVLFDPDDLKFAPDFDFDDGIPSTIEIDDVVKSVPSLVQWDLSKKESLSNVLHEFLQLFKDYQIKELQSNNIYSRIYKEYESLESNGMKKEDVEIFIDSSNIVYFLILIEVNMETLPEYVHKVDDNGTLLNPKNDVVLLSINFQKLDASKVSDYLQLSPRLSQLLVKSKKLQIPSFERDESSLWEYVSLIKILLNDQIDFISFHCQYKKEFILSLVNLRNLSIVEYDSFNFNKISFLCEVDDFHVLVSIEIGSEFPRERANVKIYSIYCFNRKTKQPCERTFEYKYMPKHNPDEAAKYLLNQLKKFIAEFEVHSHTGKN